MVEEGPQQQRAKDIYTELRQNIVDNVFKVRRRTYDFSILHKTNFVVAGVPTDRLRLGAV